MEDSSIRWPSREPEAPSSPRVKEAHCEASLSQMAFAQGAAIPHAANSVQEDEGLFPKSELRESSLLTYNLTSGTGNWGRVW